MTKRNYPFPRVGIVGLGLIGGSIAKALKSQDIRASAVPSGAADTRLAKNYVQIVPSLKKLVESSDLIIIAAPLSAIVSVAKEIAMCKIDHPLLVIDVGSVKGEISAQFRKLTKKNIEFFATHPMAGSEKSGFAAADAALFEGAPWVLVPHEKNTAASKAKLAKWIKSLGAHPLSMNSEEHDKRAALISHLPGALSAALWDFVQYMDKKSLQMAGPGFRSMTRLAHSNRQLRSEIAEFNRTHLEKAWREFVEFLDKRDIFDYN